MRVAVLITGQFRDYRVNVINHIKHLIEPNSADVFIYWCSRNTIHTTGSVIGQKHIITTCNDVNEFEEDLVQTYGKFLREVRLNEKEDLDDSDYGTIGYFRKMIMNQIGNIRRGYFLVKTHEKLHNFNYDVYVRCRPDNLVFPSKVIFENMIIDENVLYSTEFLSGWRDPCVFAFGNTSIFEKYCNFSYLKDVDGSRTDKKFDCPEIALIKYMKNIHFVKNICRPFYEYDKSKPIVDFPHRDKEQQLINVDGSFVSPVIGNSE